MAGLDSYIARLQNQVADMMDNIMATQAELGVSGGSEEELFPEAFNQPPEDDISIDEETQLEDLQQEPAVNPSIPGVYLRHEQSW